MLVLTLKFSWWVMDNAIGKTFVEKTEQRELGNPPLWK